MSQTCTLNPNIQNLNLNPKPAVQSDKEAQELRQAKFKNRLGEAIQSQADGTFEKLARANGEAIRGLEPKITVWNTGETAGSSDGTGAIRNIMQSLPPLFSTINEQTGIQPPSWLAQMGQNQDQTVTTGKMVNGKK